MRRGHCAQAHRAGKAAERFLVEIIASRPWVYMAFTAALQGTRLSAADTAARRWLAPQVVDFGPRHTEVQRFENRPVR